MAGMIEQSVALTFREAASGILGSISIACWIFLLVPQLIENYRCGSAEAISLAFLFVWFIGDLANLLGSLFAHLVPVVVTIAVYFCIADGALITQCIYYNVKNARRARRHSLMDHDTDIPEPTTPLLGRRASDELERRRARRMSSNSLARRTSHRSSVAGDSLIKILEETESNRLWVKNLLAMIAICAVGAGGWAIAWQSGVWKPTPVSGPGSGANDSAPGQVLGYISAIAYLGARIPQIFKNYREKSCEGLSLLFFILSLMGNVTYGAGILFHSTDKTYFVNNLPWLIGSLGTMLEDIMIFFQFRIYAKDRAVESTSAVA
ncbi:hypothetical protein FQN54_009495 [Arachnomyces sp. PD_36]|nr:hypothetical protein FQN54_009495 [Arachnomyces sp. PD_36]